MPLGKVRIESLFRGARALVNGSWWPSSAAGATSKVPHGETKLPARYYLVSDHDTILFVDEAARRVRQSSTTTKKTREAEGEKKREKKKRDDEPRAASFYEQDRGPWITDKIIPGR